MIIKKENKQYRIASPLLLMFSASFIVWQMGVLYFAGNTMSLFGRTPIPLTEHNTTAVIIAGYVASIIFLCLFPRKAVLAERILLPVAFISAMLTLFPLQETLVTILFYTEIFVCVFSIGTMASAAAQHFTLDTTWRDGMLGMTFGGVLIAILQNDFVQVSFTVFAVFSVLLIAALTVFFYLIPGKIEVPFVKRSEGVKSHKMPRILFIGIWLISGFSTLLICFASSFAESVSHGVGTLYLSAALLGVLFWLIRKSFCGKSLRIFGVFFMASVLGFVLAFLSLYVVQLRLVACVFLGCDVVLANLWIFFSAAAFGVYPTRFIGAIGAGQGLLLAMLHAGLLEILRDNIALLFGIYAALSVVLMIVYYFMEPYFTYAWGQKDKRDEATASAPAVTAEKKRNPFEALSEQEANLARLILDGYTESSIAAQMNITLNTQKSYRKNLYAKLDIHSKRELFELSKCSGEDGCV